MLRAIAVYTNPNIHISATPEKVISVDTRYVVLRTLRPILLLNFGIVVASLPRLFVAFAGAWVMTTAAAL